MKMKKALLPLLGFIFLKNIEGIKPPRGTPIMGWNAWNTFSINGKPLRGGRKEYQDMVDAMVESGMVAAGYTLMSTVCTDWIGRDPNTNTLQENTTLWPGGMKDFAKYVHSKGMLLSVYTDAGVKNCCGEPGSLGYEDIDMKTFAEWGVDHVGIDYCGGPTDVQAAYQKFADGIAASGRDMDLGMWNLGRGQAYKWAPAMSQNLTTLTANPPSRNGSFVPHIRLLGDIGNSWDGKVGPTISVIDTVDGIQNIPDLWNYSMGNSSGTFPNYGQLVVGVPQNHPTAGDPGLTLVEAQSHFSLWCMFASLILATNDIRLRDPKIENILFNPETIAVNQDPWTVPARKLTNINCAGEAWIRDLANGDKAILILNRLPTSIRTRLDIGLLVDEIYQNKSVNVRNLQTRASDTACGHLSNVLESHSTWFVRLSFSSTPCTPLPPQPCDAPQPSPSPPSPSCPGGPCKSCPDSQKPCPFPVPPLPSCPAGYVNHSSGYWADPDQKQSEGHSMTVEQCGDLCNSKQGCLAFEVYDPSQVTEPQSRGGSACYTFSSGLKPPFTQDMRGLIRTCTKQNLQI
eukprot:m.63538 g.63538  ORF g.63538 m.63538 type:complete len:571 (-) comp11584_c0_seq1:18-1730(-)